MVGVYGMVDEISRMLRSLLETRVTRVLGTQSIAIFMKEMMINFGFFLGNHGNPTLRKQLFVSLDLRWGKRPWLL